MNEKIKLSISLLVSNSIDTIEKCMKSIQPILQNVPSELIIVDTGGIDGSIEVARKYATKVIPFSWCNDFAKARNVGLFAAKGEWFMFLDDDEWFEDVEPIIIFFNSGEYREYNCASYSIRNYANKQGTKWEELPMYRMVKREKETEFVSPIHEMLKPVKFPEKRLNCYIHHYGYAYENLEEARKHSYRNIPLINEALKRKRDEYRLILQLIKEYCVIKEFETAENISWDAVNRVQKTKNFTKYNVRMLGWILINIIKMNAMKDDYVHAIAYGEDFVSYHWINEITKCNLYYHLVHLCYEAKEYKKIEQYVSLYEKSYEKLISDEEYRRDQSILDMENVVKESALSKVYTIGACVACRIGNKEKSEEYFSKIFELDSYMKTVEELEIILKYILEENISLKNRLLKHLSKNDATMDNISKIMDDDFFDDFMKNKICIMLSEMESNNVKILPYHIYANHLKGFTDEVKKYLNFYVGHQDNILKIMHPILTLIKRYKIDVISKIEKKELDVWTKQQNDFVLKAPEKKIEEWIAIIEQSSIKGFNTNMLYMRCMERKMRFKSVTNMTYIELQDLLEKYSSVVRDVYCHVYKEEAFSSEFNIFLPKNCRYIEKLKDVVLKKVNGVEAANIMKEASVIYPEMADFCKNYVIKMHEAERANPERNEFIELGKIIKEKINMFIRQGEYGIAMQTLNQLKVMLPDDLELLELERRIVEYA